MNLYVLAEHVERIFAYIEKTQRDSRCFLLRLQETENWAYLGQYLPNKENILDPFFYSLEDRLS